MGRLKILFIAIGWIVAFSSYAAESKLYRKIKDFYDNSKDLPKWSDFPDRGYFKHQCRYVAFRDSQSFSKLRFFVANMGKNGPLFPELPINKRITPDYRLKDVDCQAQPWYCSGRNDPYNQAILYETAIDKYSFRTTDVRNDKHYFFRKDGNNIFFRIEMPILSKDKKDQYGYCFKP